MEKVFNLSFNQITFLQDRLHWLAFSKHRAVSLLSGNISQAIVSVMLFFALWRELYNDITNCYLSKNTMYCKITYFYSSNVLLSLYCCWNLSNVSFIITVRKFRYSTQSYGWISPVFASCLANFILNICYFDQISSQLFLSWL